MNSDCAFYISKTHRICQDYAVAGSSRESAYVLLADGCSGSPDTDIGARLLVKSAQRLLPNLPLTERGHWEAYHQEAMRRAAACAGMLGLVPTCLDATLLTVIAASGAFTAACYGDGIIALGRQDGYLEVFSISFAANYPDYAAYLLDGARRAQWQAQEANEKRVERWLLGPGGVVETTLRRSDQSFETWNGDQADYRFVAVLSDGIHSFARTRATETSRATQALSIIEVLAPLLAFKSSRGQFVQRRAQAFWKECQARQWQHSDDVSLAVVWLGDD